jgi:hypothetical protein
VRLDLDGNAENLRPIGNGREIETGCLEDLGVASAIEGIIIDVGVVALIPVDIRRRLPGEIIVGQLCRRRA